MSAGIVVADQFADHLGSESAAQVPSHKLIINPRSGF